MNDDKAFASLYCFAFLWNMRLPRTTYDTHTFTKTTVFAFFCKKLHFYALYATRVCFNLSYMPYRKTWNPIKECLYIRLFNRVCTGFCWALGVFSKYKPSMFPIRTRTHIHIHIQLYFSRSLFLVLNLSLFLYSARILLI